MGRQRRAKVGSGSVSLSACRKESTIRARHANLVLHGKGSCPHCCWEPFTVLTHTFTYIRIHAQLCSGIAQCCCPQSCYSRPGFGQEAAERSSCWARPEEQHEPGSGARRQPFPCKPARCDPASCRAPSCPGPVSRSRRAAVPAPPAGGSRSRSPGSPSSVPGRPKRAVRGSRSTAAPGRVVGTAQPPRGTTSQKLPQLPTPRPADASRHGPTFPPPSGPSPGQPAAGRCAAPGPGSTPGHPSVAGRLSPAVPRAPRPPLPGSPAAPSAGPGAARSNGSGSNGVTAERAAARQPRLSEGGGWEEGVLLLSRAWCCCSDRAAPFEMSRDYGGVSG